jgi:serine/threonine protein kinase
LCGYDLNLATSFRLKFGYRELLTRISPAGKGILSMMLEVDPTKRLTASEALMHPWFQGLEFDLGSLDPEEIIILFPISVSVPVCVTERKKMEVANGNIDVRHVESMPDIGMECVNPLNPKCEVLRRSSLLKASMIRDSLKIISTAINVTKSDTTKKKEKKSQVTIVTKSRCFFSLFQFFSFKN